MIEISKQNAFILYLAFTLGSVLLLWWLQGFKKNTRYLFDYKEETFTCPNCGCTYSFSQSQSLKACPSCEQR